LNTAIASGEDAVVALTKKYAAEKDTANNLYKADINSTDAGLVADLKADSEYKTKVNNKLLELLKIYTD
jgi:hypothetical protein